jgi:tripartite-type tricarboxylate transporter receptor subunit TctC
VFAPAGTPADIVNRLNAEIVQLIREPEITARIRREGADPIGSSPENGRGASRAKSKNGRG